MSEFETKDSGERIKFSTGMQRDINDNKPRFDLVMPFDIPYDEQLLTRWAKLMQRGAVKYGNRNWEKAGTPEELHRFMDSAFRHFIQWLCDESDEDHASAVLFNIAGAEMVKWKLKQNHSRYPITTDECYTSEDDIFTEYDFDNMPRT